MKYEVNAPMSNPRPPRETPPTLPSPAPSTCIGRCLEQRPDLLRSELPDLAGAKASQLQGPDARPDQPHYGVADGLHHPPDLSLAALDHDHAHRRRVALRPDEPDRDGPRRTVVE